MDYKKYLNESPELEHAMVEATIKAENDIFGSKMDWEEAAGSSKKARGSQKDEEEPSEKKMKMTSVFSKLELSSRKSGQNRKKRTN